MEKSKGKIILWIFIIVFFIAGISALFSGSFVFALAFILMAVILFPKTGKFLSDKYHFNLTKKIKVIAIVVLLIIVGIASPKSQNTEQVAEKVNDTSNSTSRTANVNQPKVQATQPTAQPTVVATPAQETAPVNNIPTGVGAAALVNSGASSRFSWLLIVVVILIVIYAIYYFAIKRKKK